MKLNECLGKLFEVKSAQNCSIFGLSSDTRSIRPGDVFFAYRGATSDGRLYIAEALKKGAAAIVAEDANSAIRKEDIKALSEKYEKPLIWVPNLIGKFGEMVERFYKHPSKTLSLVGVTGTNGKTTTTFLIAHAWRALGEPAAFIGTLGAGVCGGETESLMNTTPDAITLSRTLLSFANRGVKRVAMEVSSHSLDQGRVNGMKFKTAVFTNLTHDHLDYHASLEAYGEAKRRLFVWPDLQHAVVNVDDPFGQSLLNDCYAAKLVTGYSTGSAVGSWAKKVDHLLTVSSALFSREGLRAKIETPWGTAHLKSPLMGRFNLSNLLAALSVLCGEGLELQAALHALESIHSVPGRCELRGGGREPLVVVDYAHTPDALEQVLKTFRELCKGKLWCVFGCGGERDKAKRPKMGAIAEEYADFVTLTSDNPRNEDPQAILQDILKGFIHPERVHLAPDRGKALFESITSASEGDILLIAGKGHEQTQTIARDGKLHAIRFCDVQMAEKALGDRKNRRYG